MKTEDQFMSLASMDTSTSEELKTMSNHTDSKNKSKIQPSQNEKKKQVSFHNPKAAAKNEIQWSKSQKNAEDRKPTPSGLDKSECTKREIARLKEIRKVHAEQERILEEKTKKSCVWVWVALAIILALAGFGIYFWMTKPKDIKKNITVVGKVKKVISDPGRIPQKSLAEMTKGSTAKTPVKTSDKKAAGKKERKDPIGKSAAQVLKEKPASKDPPLMKKLQKEIQASVEKNSTDKKE